MAKYQVKVTKVFGACATLSGEVEAKDKYQARELAKELDWSNVYEHITQDNLSESYQFAEIKVDDEVLGDCLFASNIVQEAFELQKIIEK